MCVEQLKYSSSSKLQILRNSKICAGQKPVETDHPLQMPAIMLTIIYRYEGPREESKKIGTYS